MLHDLKFALRSWRKSPGFVVVALATLALGIGANVVIFSMLNVVMLKPLPYPDPDRIVQLYETNRDGGRNTPAYPNFKDWRAQAKSFSQIEGIARRPSVLTGVERPAQLVGRAASAGYFELMGLKPILGRTFTPDEDRPGSAVVVVKHATWQTHFGGDPSIIGRTIRLNTEPFTVIGVLSPDFNYWGTADEFYVPLGLVDADPYYRNRGNHLNLQAFARLKPGVTVLEAEAELKAIAAQLAKEYPIVNTGRGATIGTLRESRFGRLNETMLALFGAVALVLLIACANVANLLLARATSRRAEISVRAALGASRWQITRQMLVESILIAAVGGCIGLALAIWGLDALKLVLPESYQVFRDVRMDAPVLAFTVIVSLLTGIVFGLAPAWHAIRDLGQGLKACERGSTGAGYRTRQALLIAEIALAVVVSVGAGLLARSLIRILNENPGFRMSNLLTAQIPLDENRYKDQVGQVAFYDKLLDRLHGIPGIDSASMIRCLPIDGACWGSIFIIGGRPIPPRTELPNSGWNVAGLDYFRVMDIKLLKGRTFLPSDVINAPFVAVISETVAHRFFPNEDPIGKRIKQAYPEDPTPWSTAIYRAELAAKLQDIGYELEHRKGHSFEIKGYSQDYLDADSARRQEIVRRMEELGIYGAENAERVSHQTRDKKLHRTAEETRSMHREMAAAFGNQPQHVVEAAHERGPREEITNDKLRKTAHQAVSFAKHRLIERSAVFDEYELVRDALHHSQGTIRLTDVEEALRQRSNPGRGEFLEVQHYRQSAPGHRYTTPEMLKLERDTIEIVRDGINSAQPIAPQLNVSKLRDKYSYLNAGQENLVLNTLHATDRIVAVQGGAGTGKTTALAPIRELVEDIGYKTRGLAPTSRAAKELRDAGLQTETLQKHVTRSSHPRNGPTVYFLDESSLASTKQVHTFVSGLRPDDRVLLIGDTRQHQSVEAGRIFDQLQQAGMTTFRLDQIVRQKNEALREVVHHLAEGQISSALLLLDEQGRIHEYENRHERIAAIARTYSDSPSNSLVVSPDNVSRRELNDAIRVELRTRGVIGDDTLSLQILQPRQGMTAADRMLASSYNEGDVIRFQRDNAAIGAVKGSYATVLKVERQTNQLTVEFSHQRVVTYNPDRAYGVQVYQSDARSFAIGDRIQFTNPWNEKGVANRDIGVITRLDVEGNITVQIDESAQRTLTWNVHKMRHIDHAYSMTSYSAQGTTVDRVLIQVDSSDSATRHLVDRSLAYVAGSRSRHDLELFTDKKVSLDKALGREVNKPTALSREQTVAYNESAHYAHSVNP